MTSSYRCSTCNHKKLFCVDVGWLTGVDEHDVAVNLVELHANEQISPEKVKKLIEKEFVEKNLNTYG